MTIPTLLVCLMITLTGIAGAADLQYISSEELQNRYDRRTSLATRHNKVPLVFQEEVLLTSKGDVARSILFVFPLSYDRVKNALSEATARSFGIESTKEAPWRLDRIYTSKERESYVEAARSLGLTLGECLETYIVSDAYNRLERSIFGKPKYYSKLQLSIVDASGVFQKPYSLVELMRKDHWPDWDGGHAVIQWLPWKATMSDYVITKGEIAFAETVFAALKPAFILSYPGEFVISLTYTDFLTRLAADLKQYDRE